MKRSELPAVVEDAPLQYALAQLKNYLSCPSPFSDAGPMTDEAGQAMARFVYQNMVTWPRGRMALAKAALDGDPTARDVLRDVLLECDSQGVPVPGELVFYRMHLVEGTGALRRGQKKEKQIMRDVCIMATIADTAREFPHLSPTGRSARRRSICEIVAQALAMLGRPIGRKGVERIWENLRGAWPRWITETE